MLGLLQIENIATIESLEAEFWPGLNLLTGETGAGKSILIDAIQAASGAKVSRELIRTGAQSAAVSALFCDISQKTVDLLTSLGLPTADDDTLLLRRVMTRDGRNVCHVNGSPATVSILKTLAADLVHIHGQRDSSTLLDRTSHLSFLDDFAGDEEALVSYRAAYAGLKSTEEKIRALTLDEGEKARRLDLLRFQVRELEEAGIEPGEIADLKRRRNILHNALKVKKALASAIEALLGTDGTGGADTLLSIAAGEVMNVTGVAKNLEVVAASLNEARETVLDAGEVLDDALRQLEENDDDIDAIEARLDLLYRLSKKYGATEEEMLAFLDEARREVDDVVFAEEKLAALEEERVRRLAEAEKTAQTLHELRLAAAETLEMRIEKELHFLDLPGAVFKVVTAETELSPTGADDVAFYFSANPGEEPKPLEKVASGGEVSRVMLAVKTVLGASGGAGTLIFDEIDAGVSGAASDKIAQKLSALARNAQVLCVTHSAQLAAYADRHLFVYKKVVNGKTYTAVKPLEDAARPMELARITYGKTPTEEQLAAARQMLRDAAIKKNENR